MNRQVKTLAIRLQRSSYIILYCCTCFLKIGILVIVPNVLHAKEIVLNTTGHSPLNEKDGSGFMDQITRLALQRIGYQLQTVKLPAERGLKNSNAGIEDGEMSRIAGIDAMYTNLRVVPEPIMNWEFVLFTKKQQAFSGGWEGLKNKTVAYINGWKILEKQVPASAETTTVKNIDQLFLLLLKDRVDYIIYERWGGLKFMKDNNLITFKLIETPLIVKPMYIYLHKKNNAIVIRLTQALQQLKKEGIYQKIYSKMQSGLKNQN